MRDFGQTERLLRLMPFRRVKEEERKTSFSRFRCHWSVVELITGSFAVEECVGLTGFELEGEVGR